MDRRINKPEIEMSFLEIFREMPMTVKLFAAAVTLFWCAAVYVAVHFIVKFW